MQCFAPPDRVKPPEYDYSAGGNAFDEVDKAYIAALKAALVEDGSTGPLTGEIVRFPVADGKAQYMVLDAPGRNPSFALVHMPLLDGYDIPEAHMRGLRKKDILEQIEHAKALAEFFKAKHGRKLP